MLFARSFIFGRNVKNTVGVNVKGHFNLRHAAWCWRNTVKHKTTQTLIVISKLALTLKNVNFHLRLVIRSRRENFTLACWNCSVSVNQLRRYTAHRLNSKRKRSHIQKQHILNITSQDTTLNCGTNSHNLIWVHALHWIFSKEILHTLNHSWHTSHSTNHNYIVNVGLRKFGILQSLFYWTIQAIQ